MVGPAGGNSDAGVTSSMLELLDELLDELELELLEDEHVVAMDFLDDDVVDGVTDCACGASSAGTSSSPNIPSSSLNSGTDSAVHTLSFSCSECPDSCEKWMFVGVTES